MPNPSPLTQRLFRTLVVGGATWATACATSPTPDRTTDLESTDDADASGPTEATEATASSDPTAQATSDAAPACECVTTDTPAECQANGVMCCWAHDPCCEPCCPA
jgi:hypothetical protein